MTSRPRYDLPALGLFWWLVFAALSVLAVLPLWRVEHPPLQDLPQHLAAVRVLRDYPKHGLGTYFVIELARTQYLAYYGAVWLLSWLLGVALANKLLLSIAIVALPWSIASLLRVLGRDPRLAVFAFALTYNAHLVLGFFNFIAALPLVFYGLARAVRLREGPVRGGRLVLAIVLVLCFYTHVVPFAFLALGTLLVLVGDGLVPTLRRGYVFAPAAVATIIWLRATPAGHATLAAAGGADSDKAPQFATVAAAIREIPMWLTDVLTSTRDDQLLIAWATLFLLAFAFALRSPVVEPALHVEAPEWTSELAFRIALLCPLAFAAYFVTPTSYDWIWPISARFPLLSLLFGILLLPRPRGFLGSAVLSAAAFVAFLGYVEVSRAFVTFEREEVGEIDAALAAIPDGQRVAGLIFDRGSHEVKFSPFLHYVALYQAEKGGAVMFTFADFPQSPFRFREDARPPRVPPRWEWQPERVDPARDLAWYRYVLVRGGPGRIAREAEVYDSVFQGPKWSVWRRR